MRPEKKLAWPVILAWDAAMLVAFLVAPWDWKQFVPIVGGVGLLVHLRERRLGYEEKIRKAATGPRDATGNVADSR